MKNYNFGKYFQSIDNFNENIAKFLMNILRKNFVKNLKHAFVEGSGGKSPFPEVY